MAKSSQVVLCTRRAIADEHFLLLPSDYIPENNLPLGVDVFRNRLFLTLPRWKSGVPFSLAWLPYPPTSNDPSPPVRVYPSWDAHSPVANPDCNKLMSVYRLAIDECDRLWIIDAGVVNATILPNPVCPPKIVVIDLHTDQTLLTYQIPQGLVREGSLHTNIVVDIRNGQCQDAHAYVTDVWRNGILVFSLAKMSSWRTTNHLYLPNPHASDYTLHGLNFQWTDGVFGLSLAPVDEYGERALFFRPMSSFNEFVVDTNILRNESIWQGYWGAAPTAFAQLSGSRGPQGQSSTVGVDRNGVQWFTLVVQDAIGCWDIRKPYDASNVGIVEQNSTTMVFPNDLKVDNELDQGVWVVSNRLPFYLYSTLDYNQINFRVLRASAARAIKGTVCDPTLANQYRFQ